MPAPSPYDYDVRTLVVSAGRGDDDAGAPLSVPPVFASAYRAGGQVDYARVDNPTWGAFEDALGVLEGGLARVFASGMATVAALLDTVPQGGCVVAPGNAYSGVRAYLTDAHERGRLRLRGVDITDTQATLDACDGAALLWAESPTNPLLGIADLRALAEGAHARGALLAVDNTFATPLLQRPLDLGADVVVHSATKFISGHSDLLLGVAVTRDPDLAAALHARRTLSGAVPGPLETWLALRGLRTLSVRLERAQSNAHELALRLVDHPAVAHVRYPGLPGHPGHDLASRQMGGFGAVVSFEVAGGGDVADAVCANVQLISYATSLGGVETTLERRNRHPGEEAVPPGLLRLSSGCEHVEDLWADLAQALDRAG